MEKPYHILVLEDEPLLRGILALLLSTNGYQVLTAGSIEDGEIVVRAMGWKWVDLVLTDANLSRDPGVLDGYLFHARWRACYPVPPFVFMRGCPSGFPPGPRVRLSGQDNCRVRHIPKPFRPDELLRLIRAVLA